MSRESLRAAVLAASVVAVAGIAAFVPVTAAPRHAPASRSVAPSRAEVVAPSDRFIVRFRSDAAERRNPVARQALLDRVSRQLGVEVTHGRGLANGADLLRTSRKLGKVEAKRLLVALRHDPRVEYVEVDRLHRPLSTPNDPLWPQQAPYLAKGTGIGIDAA